MSEQEVTKEEKVKKAPKPKYEGPVCGVCNKPLTDPESIKAGIGPLCRQKGWTKEKIQERMVLLKKEEVPAGWRKLSELADQLRLKGIPVARMVRAVGGDRGMDDPIDIRFMPAYVGRARYLDPWCFGTEAENLLSDRNLGKPAPEKKAKTPKAPKLDADGNPIVPAPKTPKTQSKVTVKADVSSVWDK